MANLRMSSSFTSGQTFVVVMNVGEWQWLVVGLVVQRRIDVDVGQTVETFGGVEIELIAADGVVQSEEAFDFLQFRPRIANELICICLGET